MGRGMEYALHMPAVASGAGATANLGTSQTTRGRPMLTAEEREAFALRVMGEMRRWPGVEMRSHASALEAGAEDGVEFRLAGRQIGHMHGDCAVHLSLTKALKHGVLSEQLAEPLPVAPSSAWVMFNPMSATDVEHAIWLLRLNYVRLRRQRLTPLASASSELLQQHEAALGSVSSSVASLLQKTQLRSKPRPMRGLEA